jgi:hypothetical protein
MGAVSRQLWTCSTPARDVLDPTAVAAPLAVFDSDRCANSETVSAAVCAPALTVRCVTFNMNSCPPLHAGALLQLLVRAPRSWPGANMWHEHRSDSRGMVSAQQGGEHGADDVIIIGSQESGPDVQLWRSQLLMAAGADWQHVASNILLSIAIVVLAHTRAQQRLTRVQTCRVATGRGLCTWQRHAC